MRIAARVVRAAAATSALAVLLAGVPAALAHFVGWPLPDHVPVPSELAAALTAPLGDDVIVNGVACAVWVAWAALLVSTLLEVVAGIAGWSVPRLPGIGWAHALAAALIAAITTTAPAIAATGIARPASYSTVLHGTDRSSADHTSHGRPPGHPHPGRATQPPSHAAATPPTAAAGPTHRVAPGENLWTIAARRLGPDADPAAIIRLVHAITDANTVIVDPDHIEPGWNLAVPAAGDDPRHRPAQHHRPRRRTETHPQPRTTPTRRGEPTPPASPAATPPASSPVTPPPQNPARHDHRGGHGGFITLPSGALAGAALAGAVAGAVILTHARRRRTYTPRHPVPGRAPRQRPFSAVIQRLLQLDRRTRQASQEGTRSAPGDDVQRAPASMWAGAATPAHIEAGARGSRPVALDLLAYSGFVLTGPGAAAALRGMMTALYARSADVEITYVDPSQQLLDPDVGVPGVQSGRELAATAAHLEAASIGRVRMLTEQGTPDFRTYRRRHPEDPCPLLVLAAWEPPTDLARRIAALARAGQDRGIVVLAGAMSGSSDGYVHAGMAGVQVDAAGRVNRAAPEALSVALERVRLQAPDPAETTEILRTLAAHRAPDEPAGSEDAVPRPDTERMPDSPPPRRGPPRSTTAQAGGVTPPLNAMPAPAARAIATSEGPDDAHTPGGPRTPGRPRLPGGPLSASGAPHRGEASAPPARTGVPPAIRSTEAPVRVRVLGPIQVTAAGEEIRTGLRTTSRELLAWFALHPGGVNLEQTLDNLWPVTEHAKSRRRFWSALSTLRTRLREALDRADLHFIGRDGGLYRIRGQEMGIDLWDFEAALAVAARAGDPDVEAAALRDAIAAYGGDFATGTDILWAEPAREDLRRRALDTHVRLAELEAAAGQNHRALATLDAARHIDPYAEEVYRRLMRLHHRLGDLTAARTVFTDLRDRLADLDIAPSPATIAIVNTINTEQRRERLRGGAPDAITDPGGIPPVAPIAGGVGDARGAGGDDDQ